MRISRKKRPQKPLIPHFRINTFIKTPTLRLLGPENEYLGIVSVNEALKKAEEFELDLVEINPKAEPPVAQIMNFKHFKYQKEKEMRKQKAHSRASELKGIRLSIRIGKHDLEIRQKQTEKFLDRGDKVKIDVMLKGAEKAKAHLAFDLLKSFCEAVAQNMDIKFEQEPQRQGHMVSAIITKK